MSMTQYSLSRLLGILGEIDDPGLLLPCTDRGFRSKRALALALDSAWRILALDDDFGHISSFPLNKLAESLYLI